MCKMDSQAIQGAEEGTAWSRDLRERPREKPVEDPEVERGPGELEEGMGGSPDSSDGRRRDEKPDEDRDLNEFSKEKIYCIVGQGWRG